MDWTVESAQDEDTWFADLVGTVLASPCAVCKLPPNRERIGQTNVTWFETEPGVAFIHTTGGTTDDRILAQEIVRASLAQAGIRQAHFTFEPELTDELRKEATWNDIMAKAKRLIQSGNVKVLRNSAEAVVGHVVGDHGEYQTEIAREDPNSQVITQWQCECPWDQFAFQRTRQWKKYEGRPCAHVLATYWAAKGMPLDEDRLESQGQGTLFDAGPAQGVLKGQPRPPTQVYPGQQLSIPGVSPGTADSAPPAPSQGVPAPPQIIPQQPGVQVQEVNPVSVPGLRQPTPANPVQYPGGTFSSWDFGDSWVFESAKGDKFENSDMAQVMVATLGVAEGKSQAHGAGGYRDIPRNAIVEVLGQDSTTGWVDCIWPLKDSGPMEPFHVRAWIPAEDLTPRPDIQKPGPFIKRRSSNVELAIS